VSLGPQVEAAASRGASPAPPAPPAQQQPGTAADAASSGAEAQAGGTDSSAGAGSDSGQGSTGQAGAGPNPAQAWAAPCAADSDSYAAAAASGPPPPPPPPPAAARHTRATQGDERVAAPRTVAPVATKGARLRAAGLAAGGVMSRPRSAAAAAAAADLGQQLASLSVSMRQPQRADMQEVDTDTFVSKVGGCAWAARLLACLCRWQLPTRRSCPDLTPAGVARPSVRADVHELRSRWTANLMPWNAFSTASTVLTGPEGRYCRSCRSRTGGPSWWPAYHVATAFPLPIMSRAGAAQVGGIWRSRQRQRLSGRLWQPGREQPAGQGPRRQPADGQGAGCTRAAG
jgi:hypothetical protein